MAVKTTITNKGLQLLASSSQATGQYYWLGYYGLAYVPDFWKTTEPEIEFPDASCFKVNSGDTIDASETEPVVPTMQRLTTNGDMVWNVWQGDLTGTGFVNESDGTPGGNLFGLTMYSENVKKHYRYVLDENGNNLLVCWINDPSSTTGEMLKQTVYYGTDGFVESELPIPAPLYYLGDVTGKFSTQDFFPDFADSDENGSSIYPFIDVETTIYGDITIPKVSADYRGYLDTLGNGVTAPYAPIAAGAFFDSTEIPPTADPSFDVTGWYAGNLTYTIPESTPTLNNNPAKFDTEFWKLHTSSNYNRWHAPVDNIGFVLSSDLSNRNMAKTSKFFPISNYKTINTESGFRSDGQSVEIATAIQLTIDLDISPTDLNNGTEPASLPSFDKYSNADNDPAQSPQDQFGNSVYNTTHSSFKFNRIGIYAVPLRKYPCVQDQGFGSVPPTTSSCNNVSGSAVELQFQIDPDEEPVLFAVLDWDNTVTLDDTGNGISSFRAEVNVNMESPGNSIEDCALIRDCTIFYNLYEDDALKWYQNQLIANAQTQNAITELGLELNSFLNREGVGECCPTPDLSNLYALKNHTHTNLGLRNLKDSFIKANNGLRGIVTLEEGVDLGGSPYALGLQSVALGFETASAAINSTVAGGDNNIIFEDAIGSFIGGGFQNTIEGTSSFSAILSGQQNQIIDSSMSVILNGPSHTITNSERSIVSGTDNTLSDSLGASIFSGTTHELTSNSQHSSMLGGANNQITESSYASIIGGTDNRIECTDGNTDFSNVIIGSNGNTILTSSSRVGIYSSASSTVSASSNSSIMASINSGIGSGKQSVIIASSGIVLSDTVGPEFDVTNVAAIARTEAISDPAVDATLYTDNINFFGDMTANNTLGSDGDVLTKVGGIPVWSPNAAQFNWTPWPQPTTNVPAEISITAWSVEYAIVGDMVFLRGSASVVPNSTGWTLTTDANIPSGIIPTGSIGTLRNFSLYDYCVGAGIGARVQKTALGGALYLSGMKQSSTLRTTQTETNALSSSTVAPGLGTKAFSVATFPQIGVFSPDVGSNVSITSGSDTMIGNFISSTGAGPYTITVNVTYVSPGAVTHSDWNLNFTSQGGSGLIDNYLMLNGVGMVRDISFNGTWYPL